MRMNHMMLMILEKNKIVGIYKIKRGNDMNNNDLKNLNYSEGFGYVGNVSIDFFERNMNVEITINSETEEIADIQEETYKKFKEKWNELQKSVAERIIKYYNEEEKGSYGPDDKNEFNKWWPEINTENELLEQIEFETIVIPETFIMEDVTNGRCLYLLFNKKWGDDIDDNGIRVQIVNEEIVQIGFKDIAF